jgi:probable HAF family extracellular repeat protein
MSVASMAYANYLFTTIDVPGASSDNASGINDSGQIVGSFTDANNWTHGFLYSGGSFTTIDYPNTSKNSSGFFGGTEANGINNSGQVVGFHGPTTLGVAPGYLYSGGSFTSISAMPNAFTSAAYGINDAGQIAGTSELTSGSYYPYPSGSWPPEGFLYSGGSFTPLAPPNSYDSAASGINNAGQIVGGFANASNTKWAGFLYSGGSYSVINVPGSTSTTASGINNAGQIVGNYTDSAGKTHGFLLEGSTFITMDVPGAVNTWDSGINNLGDIVGQYVDAAGQQHGFLATPTPIPGLVWLFGSFTGSGIWQWDGTNWTQVTPNNPQLMVTSGSNLYGDFTGQGIWQWNGTNWTQVTPNDPQLMVATGTTLYGSFAGGGIWQWNGSSWTQVTPNNPQSMVTLGSNLYGSFAGSGIWQWNGTNWTQVASYNPYLMVTTGTTLYGSFAGSGIWEWDGTNWTQVTTSNAKSMVASGSTLYASFKVRISPESVAGAGIWQWDGSSWTQVTPNTPDLMVATSTSLYGSFAGSGIWMWDGSSWTQVTPNTPQLMVTAATVLSVEVIFAMGADDYGALTIDGTPICTYDNEYAAGGCNGTFNMTPGVWYDISIDYKNRLGTDGIALSWSQPGTGTQACYGSSAMGTAPNLVPKVNLRSPNGAGGYVSGLNGNYYDLSGNFIESTTGEGPIDAINTCYNNNQSAGSWAGEGYSSLFEERITGQICVSNCP